VVLKRLGHVFSTQHQAMQRLVHDDGPDNRPRGVNAFGELHIVESVLRGRFDFINLNINNTFVRFYQFYLDFIQNGKIVVKIKYLWEN
jgi:hypothetical protein